MRNWILTTLPLAALALPSLCGDLLAEPTKAELPPAAKQPVDFHKQIVPILANSCIKCHGNRKHQGEFSLDTREALLKGGESGAVVKVGHSGESRLIHLVAGLEPDSIMPKKGPRLSAEQIGLLRAWIDQGAAWDESFTFRKSLAAPLKPRRVELPPIGPAGANPIDRLLAGYLSERKVQAGPPVDDRTYIRRVSLDTIGLPPTPEEIKQFSEDQQSDKRERLVRRLLADRVRYAEHWLSFWNDALRNDYRGTGYIDGGRQQITDWLYRSLADNMPYDKFVAELISPQPGSAGFVKGIVWRGVVNASQTPPVQAAQNISQVFMGLNIKCASCHDSFINDWKLADAYGLAGIFSDTPLEMHHCDKPTGKFAEMKFLFPELGGIDPKAPRAKRLEQLAAAMTSRENGRLARTIVNRLWARIMGRGLIEPVDEMDNAAWNADVLDWLAADLADNKYDLKHTLELILTSRAYQMPAVGIDERGETDFVFRGPIVRRLSAEQFIDAVSALAGVAYAGGAFNAPAIEGASPSAPGQRVAIRAAMVNADPLLLALGRPNREQVVTDRAKIATTLQALELTNGTTLDGLLEKGAKQLAAANKSPPGELVAGLYQQALGRGPTAEEAAAAEALIGAPISAEGIEDLLWILVMLPEFQLIY